MRATVITAACLFLLAGASAQQGKPKASAVPSGKAVLEAYVSAWNRHDFAALDKLLTPDAVHEDIAWPSRDVGPAQIKEFMRQMIEVENSPPLSFIHGQPACRVVLVNEN
jgi:ketosteroid isomerase-like protein